MATFETFACGRYCFPQQGLYIDTIERKFAICNSFCRTLYSSCANAVIISRGRTVSSVYRTARAFCEAQRFDNYTVQVNQRDLCFNGLDVDASDSHSHLSGLAYWLSQDGRSGVPYLPYCLKFQVEDYYENPKQIGGDSVLFSALPVASLEADPLSPEEEPTPLDVTDNQDGTYSTCLTSPDRAIYNISYSINDNEALSFTVAITNASWCPLKSDISGYSPRPSDTQALPCEGSLTDANCCPEFAVSSCCDASTQLPHQLPVFPLTHFSSVLQPRPLRSSIM